MYNSIPIKGFNIEPGCAFLYRDAPVIAMKVWRNPHSELNHIIAREVTGDYMTLSVAFDYSEDVRLIGVSVHPGDLDDLDMGVYEVPEHTDPIKESLRQGGYDTDQVTLDATAQAFTFAEMLPRNIKPGMVYLGVRVDHVKVNSIGVVYLMDEDDDVIGSGLRGDQVERVLVPTDASQVLLTRPTHM